MTQDSNSKLDRTSLPLPDTPTGGRAARTISESVMPVITPIRPPQGAPNVVIVLLDDVGFGATATFGGPVPSPTGDALAREGLRYNRFHTTALCSPTRAALLTGRNHHAVNTGNITEWATGYDGYNSIIPRSAATVAETLRLNGYSTAAFGKWHNTPVWEVSPSGPFDRWPTSMGFEEFYDFMGGEAHQYNSGLYHGTTPVERPEFVENYHLTTDLADRMIEWVHRQRSISPERDTRTTPLTQRAPRKPATPRGSRQPTATKTKRAHRTTARIQATHDRSGPPTRRNSVSLSV
jgi:arylsulfatase A-like enzyme